MSDDLTGNVRLGLDDSKLESGIKETTRTVEKGAKDMVNSISSVQPAFDKMGKGAQAATIRAVGGLEQATARTKNLQLELDKVNAKTKQLETHHVGTALTAETRGVANLNLAKQIGDNAKTRAEEQRLTDFQRTQQTLRLKNETEVLRDRRNANKRFYDEEKADAAKVASVLDKTLGLPAGTREKVASAIGGPVMARRRQAMQGFGMTRTEALHAQLSESFSPEEAQFLVGKNATLPVTFGGKDTAAEQALRDQQKLGSEMNAMTNRNLKDQKAAASATAKAEAQYYAEWGREAAGIQKGVTASAKEELKKQEQFYKEWANEASAMQKAVSTTAKTEAKAQTKAESDELAFRSREAKAFQKDSLNASKARTKQVESEAKEVEKVLGRALQGSPELQQQIKNILTAPGAGVARMGLTGVGLLPQQALSTQLQAGGIEKQIANFISGVSGTKRPVALGGQVSGAGGGRGILSGILQRLGGAGGGGVTGSLIGGLLGGIGVGVGGYAVANAAQQVVDSAKTATAYERQMVAAKNLAGGQAQLNALLADYDKASGGAISKTDALANVTRLLSTGYAGSVKQLDTFVRATRGASIALGKDQEQVTQDIQLAISNTSIKRLDNIGLGIKEVNDRIQQLRKTNAGWTRETAFGQAVLQLLDEKYGKLSKSVEGQATGLERLAKAWTDVTLAEGKYAKSPINKLAGGLADFLNNMAGANGPTTKGAANLDFLPKWLKEGVLGTQFTPRMLGKDNAYGKFFDPLTSRLAGYGGDYGAYNASMIMGGYFGAGAGTQTRYHGGSPSQPAAPKSRWDTFSDAQQQTLTDAYKAFGDAEKNYDKQRLDEINSFNESVASSEKNFHKSQLREDEDFARSRARAERDYNKQVNQAISDAAERDAQSKIELDKGIARDTRDSDKRLQDIQQQYNDQQEQAEKQHRLSMLQSAGQLDAVALLNERMSYALSQKEAKKAHDKQVSDEKDSLAQRIQDAKDNYKDQLDQAHAADKKRLDQMAADHKQQLDDEDVDRGIQKAREIQDHNDELAEMTRVHNAKMDDIKKQYDDQVAALNDALEADLVNVGIFVDGYLEKQAKKDKAIEDWYDKQVDKIEAIIKGENSPVVGRPNTPQMVPAYALGGPVSRTGLAVLHAGEYVLPKHQVASMSSMMNTSSSKVVQVNSGAFQVYTTPGMEMMVGKQIEEILLEILGAA